MYTLHQEDKQLCNGGCINQVMFEHSIQLGNLLFVSTCWMQYCVYCNVCT